jgi:hypothetical protein
MAIGDHIKVRRLGMVYAHHGIDMGDGSVIHFTDRNKSKLPDDGQWPRIVRTSMGDFLDGGELIPVLHKPKKSLSVMETTRLAQQAMHEPRKYSLIFSNCEHFANYCKTGKAKSSQVKKALSLTAPVLMVLAGIFIKGRRGPEA